MALTKAQLAQASASLIKRIPQAVAAEVIGKPAVWLRDNPDVGGRNADGSYNLPDLVAGMRERFKPAELPDSDLESVLQATEALADMALRPQTIARLMERLESSHGAAGLAAFAAELLIQLLHMAALHDRIHSCMRPTPEQIKAEADQRLAELAEWDARAQGRVAVVCGGCDSYRWGRSWREGPAPTGYAVDRDHDALCPACEKASRKKRPRPPVSL